jgi:transcriptional regulator with XRE-family HTH domain
LNRTADFAARVQNLRQRAGLSYGALARRLDMSTSTLHRYCNGDALPREFASVDRLARACSASDDELMDLHRLWMLADTERAASGQDAGLTPTALVAEALKAEVPAARAERGRRRVPRSLTVVAAAVVAGLTSAGIALPLLAHRDAGEKRLVSSGPVAPESTATASRAGVPPAVPSASGKTSATAGPTSRKGSTATNRAVAGGRPSRTVTNRSTEPDEDPPMAVSVRPFTWEDPCSQHYLIKADPADVPPRPLEQDAPGWVSALDGISAANQRVALTVQGTGTETVVLESMRVRVVGSDAPPAWNDYTMGDGCGGNVDTKQFDIDLDTRRPIVRARSGQRDFPFTVSQSAPQVLYVNGAAESRDVHWYLELTWSSGDRRGVIRVDDKGKPFHTSASVGRPSYVWELGKGEGWHEAESTDS